MTRSASAGLREEHDDRDTRTDPGRACWPEDAERFGSIGSHNAEAGAGQYLRDRGAGCASERRTRDPGNPSALKTANLLAIKTLEGFDFSFQPSLDRERIAALAQLDFIRRAEVVHFPGAPHWPS